MRKIITKCVLFVIALVLFTLVAYQISYYHTLRQVQYENMMQQAKALNEKLDRLER